MHFRGDVRPACEAENTEIKLNNRKLKQLTRKSQRAGDKKIEVIDRKKER